MNEFGLILLGAAVRATALAVFGLVAMLVLRRRGPGAGALAGSTTLAVMLGVAALAVSPWPHWWSPSEAGTVPQPTVSASSGEDDQPVAAEPMAAIRPAVGVVPSSGWSFFAEEFRRELARPASSETRNPRWRWPAWVGCLWLAGLAVGLLRLGLGIWAVRALRSGSQPIDDPGISTRLVELRGLIELGLVNVRMSPELTTPATVGWLRPVVLLPPVWQGWTDDERRAVLAHELAHVARGDYLTGLIAQLSLSLHFYHPLAHALTRHLRLQQELAADAWGARLTGGRRPYLTTLANLALRQDPRPPAWPARPFLPSRGTFLRRIEMLRDPKILDHPPMPARGRACTVATLIAAGLLVAGLRGPGTTNRALAQEPSPPPKPAPVAPDLGFLDAASVSSDVHLVIDIRPLPLLRQPEFQKLVEQLPADNLTEFVAIASGQIEQILVLGFEGQRDDSPPRFMADPVFVMRSKGPYAWKNFVFPKAEEVQGDGFTYWRANPQPGASCFRVLDDRTLLIGQAPDLKLPPIGLDRPKGRHGWDNAWKQLSPAPIRVAIDTPWLFHELKAGPQSSLMRLISPLLEKTQAYAMNLDIANGLTIDALATSGDADAAARVTDTLRAVLTLARNSVPDLRLAAERAPRGASRALVDLVDSLDSMLETAKVDQDKAVARLHIKGDAAAVATAARMLLPAATASREAARRAISVNNLKQIGLAMHNYHFEHKCFPPAVLYGPDGKTPYSWRVALLPYLAAESLYKEYKFAEPWDGLNNRKLIERMPDVFHDPSHEDAWRGAPSYFVPTGPDTLFPPRKDGMGTAEVFDGTSNTIMAFEAKRDIPWTKPEDIPIDADRTRPLPQVGGLHPGGYNVLIADGSVKFLKQEINPMILRALISPASGEVINADSF